MQKKVKKTFKKAKMKKVKKTFLKSKMQKKGF